LRITRVFPHTSGIKEENLFDPEGIFIGDASYVFVPDNENYEGSVVMLFDENNHPVDKEELTERQLRRCTYKRCYKWVELIHTNRKGEFFFFVGMRLGSGKKHECPILYEIVENFLNLHGQFFCWCFIRERVYSFIT